VIVAPRRESGRLAPGRVELEARRLMRAPSVLEDRDGPIEELRAPRMA
jgi:hypothetical protein